jgi:hypothetical protein
MTECRLLNEQGNIEFIDLNQWLDGDLQHLPDEPARYFEHHPSSVLVPISKLINSRARPKGIQNANRYMREAFDGSRALRAPITVGEFSEDLWVVKDGNSTVINTILFKWLEVPCLVASD